MTTADVACNTYALIEAAREGNAERVRALIPVGDPRSHNSSALRVAADWGRTKCVELLIPVSDPKAWNSSALQTAAVNGHLDCVKLLIPHSDPKANGSMALRWAAKEGHMDIVDLLWEVSDPHAVLEKLQQEHPEKHHLWSFFEQRVLAEQQHAELTNTLSNTAKPNGVRKLRHI